MSGVRGRFGAYAFALFVLFVGTNVPSPLYRRYAERFGFSPLVITLIFATYIALIIPSLLVCGPLSDAWGRRAVLVPGLICAAVGAALFAGAGGTGWLFAGRAAQGLSMGACSGPLLAGLAEAAPGGDARRAALTATACNVGGAGFGPLLAGGLAQYGPWPDVFVFLVVIVALGLAVVGIARCTPPPAQRQPWRPRVPQLPAGSRGEFFSASMISFLVWSVTGVFLSLVPSYTLALASSSNLLLAGTAVAVLFGCSSAVQLATRNVRSSSGQIVGLGLLVGAMVLLVGAGEVRSLPLLLASTAIAGCGQGLGFAAAMGDITAIAPPERRAEVFSSFYVLTYAGTGGPVIGVGLLATRTSLLRAVEVFSAVIVVLCLATIARLVARSMRRPAPSSLSALPATKS